MRTDTDAIDADIQEYLGWRLAEEVLEDMRTKFGPSSEFLHVEDPEIIRLHLTRVVRPSSEQEFVLRRVLEATAYPTMATDRLRLLARRLRQRIHAGLAIIESPEDDDRDNLASLASFVKVALEAKGATLENLASSLGNVSKIRSPPRQLNGIAEGAG